jgi:hypothetical protein
MFLKSETLAQTLILITFFRYHHVLKGTFLEGVRNRRIDHLLYALFERALPYYQYKEARCLLGFEGKTAKDKKILDIEEKAASLSKEAIIDGGKGVFLVQSQSKPSISYHVNREGQSCTCPSFPIVKCCKHLVAVLHFFPIPPLPDSLATNDEDEDLGFPSSDGSQSDSEADLSIESDDLAFNGHASAWTEAREVLDELARLWPSEDILSFAPPPSSLLSYLKNAVSILNPDTNTTGLPPSNHIAARQGYASEFKKANGVWARRTNERKTENGLLPPRKPGQKGQYEDDPYSAGVRSGTQVKKSTQNAQVSTLEVF